MFPRYWIQTFQTPEIAWFDRERTSLYLGLRSVETDNLAPLDALFPIYYCLFMNQHQLRDLERP